MRLDILKDTNKQQKMIKTLKKISLLISSLLIYLVRSNLLILTRPIKKIKIIKEVFIIIKNKDKYLVTTSLQQLLKSFLIRRKKTSSILNTSFTIEKDIILAKVPKKEPKN